MCCIQSQWHSLCQDNDSWHKITSCNGDPLKAVFGMPRFAESRPPRLSANKWLLSSTSTANSFTLQTVTSDHLLGLVMVSLRVGAPHQAVKVLAPIMWWKELSILSLLSGSSWKFHFKLALCTSAQDEFYLKQKMCVNEWIKKNIGSFSLQTEYNYHSTFSDVFMNFQVC